MNVEVRFTTTTFKVEHVKCMICTFLKSMSVKIVSIILPGITENFIQIFSPSICASMSVCVFCTGNSDQSRPKVNLDIGTIMNTASVTNKHSVDVQPCIIVSREFKFHVLIDTLWIKDLSSSRHRKLSIHMHSDPVISITKWPEPSHRCIVRRLFRQSKILTSSVKRCPIITAVERIITILINIQQMIRSRISGLSGM